MAPPPPRSHQGPPPARPPKSSSQAPLLDPPIVPEAFRPGKGRTSTLTSPPPLFSNSSETSTLRADERDLNSKEGKSSPKERDSSSKKRKEQVDSMMREDLHSPSPPPPPSLTSLGEQEEFPPPPSYSTLKRLTTYRRWVQFSIRHTSCDSARVGVIAKGHEHNIK